MKRYFMSCGLVAVLAAVSFQAMSEENVSIDGVAYKSIEVNGQRYFIKDSGQRTRAKRSTDGSATPGLYAGDVVRRDSVEPELQVSGSILVHASEPEAQEIAQRYGLVLQHQIGQIALLKASSSTDLAQLAVRLRQEGHNAEIEVAGPLAQPN